MMFIKLLDYSDPKKYLDEFTCNYEFIKVSYYYLAIYELANFALHCSLTLLQSQLILSLHFIMKFYLHLSRQYYEERIRKMAKMKPFFHF